METWLVRILINLCNTKYKRYKKQAGIEEMPEEATYADFENLPLKDAMAKLPEQYCEVIVLKYFGGYTISEIGKMLNIPQGTIAPECERHWSYLD